MCVCVVCNKERSYIYLYIHPPYSSAMANNLTLPALFFFGTLVIVLIGSNVEKVEAENCTETCYTASEMSCPGSGYQKPACNCCVANSGCTFSLTNGSVVHCA
ncbi:hypothetical protein RND81_04G197300 [Saponaria officinalis]|uniref:Uncharacterized protein n=1 Tax=Saponaria officinalis TaxID=3572 RepID=A0AAW1LN37_SAPOF